MRKKELIKLFVKDVDQQFIYNGLFQNYNQMSIEVWVNLY